MFYSLPSFESDILSTYNFITLYFSTYSYLNSSINYYISCISYCNPSILV